MTDRGPSIGDQLAAHLRAGTILDLIQRQPADTLLGEAEMQAWDDSHNIEADLIRDLLRGRTVSDPDPRGLRLRGGRICGQLDLDRLDTTIALELRDCLLENGITADWAHLPAVLLHRCRLSNPIGPALSGGRLRVETSVSLVGSVLRADSADGAVILSGAYIAGQLFCQGTKLCNSVGAALSADGLWTGGNVSLGGDFTADGAGASGAIRLPGAHIGGQLRCSGAILRNATGPALFADGLQVDRGLFFDEGFVAHGVDRRGAVRLIGARVGLRFDCQGATLSNPIGPALVADGIHVDEAVFFNRGFSADGADEGGTIRLLGAKIGGRLNCGGATLRNSSGPALAADGMQTDGNVLLHKRFTAEGVGKRGTVRLLGVHIGGRIDCRDSVIISNSNPLERWILDGLTYSGIPQIDSADRHREAWLELLRTATPSYTAQPYQQLATVYRSIGHDSDVRAILIAQRDHQLERRALTRRSDG
jgi:hypothetical protein